MSYDYDKIVQVATFPNGDCVVLTDTGRLFLGDGEGWIESDYPSGSEPPTAKDENENENDAPRGGMSK